jgi:hypothetical protein
VHLRALVLAALAAAPTARAQEPSGGPPPSSQRESAGLDVRELLPDIGRIGAQVGALAGVSWNPYQTGQGLTLAGFIDLPLTRVPGGKLSYEIELGASLATSDPFPVGRGQQQIRLRAVDAAPFSLRYTLMRSPRLRPYLVAGVDVLIATTRLEPAVQAPELEARGVRAGTATIELGAHAGVGLEVRLSGGLSWNSAYRFAAFQGREAKLHCVVTGLGIHW